MHISSLGFSEIKLLSATCPGALPYYTWARVKRRHHITVEEGEAKKPPKIDHYGLIIITISRLAYFVASSVFCLTLFFNCGWGDTIRTNFQQKKSTDISYGNFQSWTLNSKVWDNFQQKISSCYALIVLEFYLYPCPRMCLMMIKMAFGLREAISMGWFVGWGLIVGFIENARKK